MSRTEKIYTLTKAILHRLQGKGFIMNCHKCQEPFRPGQRIVSRNTNGRTTHQRNHYHVECWDKMFI